MTETLMMPMTTQTHCLLKKIEEEGSMADMTKDEIEHAIQQMTNDEQAWILGATEETIQEEIRARVQENRTIKQLTDLLLRLNNFGSLPVPPDLSPLLANTCPPAGPTVSSN